MNYIKIWVFSLLLSGFLWCQNALAISVAASIKPLHSLVMMVTEGILTPELIVKNSVSSHDIKLSAKTIKNLKNTNLVFIISKDLEQPIFKALYSNNNLYQAINFKDLTLLKVNYNNVIFKDNIHKLNNGLDFHIWLDPLNAKVILLEIANILSKYDSSNAAQYKKNAIKYAKKIDDLNKKLKNILSPYNKSHFILYHNGFAYLENRYNLKNTGIIQGNCHSSNHFLINNLSNKKLLLLNNFINKNHVSCVFIEPEFNNKVLLKYLNEHKINYAIIDPIGYNIKASKDLYFKLIVANSNALKSCLSKNN